MIWLVLVAIAWQHRVIINLFKKAGVRTALAICFAGLLLTPLILAIARQPNLIRPYIGLPTGQLPTAYEYLRHVLGVPLQIFGRGPDNPSHWLGRLPLLDIFAGAMALLGVYAAWVKRRLDRNKLLAGLLIMGALLIGLQGPVSIIFLAPVIYIIVAGGMDYLLGLWHEVFPRNPLARKTGMTLLTVVVLLAGFYNLRNYFVAWPQATATKQVFEQRL